MSGPERRDPPSLEAFVAALRARKPQIVEGWLEVCRRYFPAAVEGAGDAFRASLDADVEANLAAFEDPEAKAIGGRARGWYTAAVDRGLSAEVLLATAAESREVILDAALAVHAEGVPFASHGIRRLMAVQSEIGMILDEVYRGRAERAEAAARVFESVTYHSPDCIGVARMDGIVVYANPAFEELLGYPIVGRDLVELTLPADREYLTQEVKRRLLETGSWSGLLRYAHADGSPIEAHVTAFLVRDEQGNPTARCAILRDMAPLRRAEEERRKLQEEVIAAQRAALQELSTPLVPIAQGVVVMPLVGAIDAARADRMLGALLEGIVGQSARLAILDVTAVKGVDAQVAEALLGAARAARLVGAEVVLTGIQPAVAQSIVEIGADLGTIATMSTLGEGIRYALGRARARG
ncbi:PAS domain S-box protein [Polyangium aurulentum]|uniref:PAS domain S-box protein n=1 Tax=Polyangium aurulentum TaxID=2567896 RepID=UPI0010AEE7EA|nr:PAS domain S-box protein [Polyangium aurulentum]UQA60231.1 PAS domain S-box protein [Polyangium aurulentum]